MLIIWLVFISQGLVSFLIKETPWFLENMNILSWYIVTITSMVFTTWVLFKYKDFTVILIILAGYFMRILLLYWDLYQSNIMHSGSDTENFYMVALRLYNGHRWGHIFPFSEYIYSIFRIVGPQRVFVQYVNLLISVTAILLAHRIIVDFKVRKNISMLFLALGMFVPNFMMLNVILLREAIISGFLLMSLYFFVLWFRKNNMPAIIFAMICVLIATDFHRGAIAQAIGFAVVAVFYDKKSQAFKFNKSTIIMMFFVVLSAYVIDDLTGGSAFSVFGEVDGVAGLTDRAGEPARGAAAYAAFIPTGNPITDFILNTPIRMFYFALSPVPWYWRSVNDIIAFALSSVFYGAAYFATFKALKITNCEHRDIIVMLLIVCMAGIFLYGWGVGNAGTAMRHRDKFFLQHMLMLSMSINAILIKRRERKEAKLYETVLYEENI